MNQKVFDALRIIAIVVIALGVLYGVFADAWGLPYKEAIALSANGIGAFIETLLQIESKSFFKDKEIIFSQPQEVNEHVD